MNLIKSTILLSVILLFHIVTQASSGFTMTCQTLNADTLQAQTAFHPGDRVVLSITTSLPDATAANKQMTINVHATARIAGVRIPFQFNPDLNVPNTDPTIAGLPAMVRSGTHRRTFRIPPAVPYPSSLTLGIQVFIQTVGSGSCTATITVVHP